MNSAIVWDVALCSLLDVSEESAASIFRLEDSADQADKQAEMNS
jgi:hypothetical protein